MNNCHLGSFNIKLILKPNMLTNKKCLFDIMASATILQDLSKQQPNYDV